MINDNFTQAINTCSTFQDFAITTTGANTISTCGPITTSGGTGYYTYVPWSGYYWYSSGPNTTEQAYKVVRALMKAKLVKITSLSKFFDLMDEVAKVL